MKRGICFSILAAFVLITAHAQDNFDLQGHRGCRGLMPENSMPGFLKAVELGVTTLEMDLVVSMDGQLVVSHEPWMSSVICKDAGGKNIEKKSARKYNLYRMKYADIQQFDCGSRGQPDFPHQQSVPSVKPTLKMVVKSVERFALENRYAQPRYNLEFKSSPDQYGVYVPEPAVFVELVLKEVRRLDIEGITTFQSMDLNILRQLHRVEDRIYKISFITYKGKNVSSNIRKLGFVPDIYSPHVRLVSPAMISAAHDLKMKVIPWTVNSQANFQRLVSWGVDGVITDYPDTIRK